MKITNALVKEFENNQKQYGTKIALHNLLWEFASRILFDLGVKKVSTTYAQTLKAMRKSA